MDRKITALYHLAYPDSEPDDPLVAGSEVYIEIGHEGSRQADFDDTYSLFVCTPAYLTAQLAQRVSGYWHFRNILVVSRFDSALIQTAIESFLTAIERHADKK